MRLKQLQKLRLKIFEDLKRSLMADANRGKLCTA